MKQFAVIGLGSFGMSIGRTLVEQGHETLGIDIDEGLVHEAAQVLTHVVQADATEEEALRALGLRNFDAVVVAIGTNLEASILVTLLLKELGARLVVAKASTELHGKVLSRIGADRVVFPERDMGARVAHYLVASNILDYVELSPKYSIMELTADAESHGRSLRELDLRNRYGVTVLAIKRGDEIKVSPQADDRLEKGDVLVVIGSQEGLRRLERN